MFFLLLCYSNEIDICKRVTICNKINIMLIRPLAKRMYAFKAFMKAFIWGLGSLDHLKQQLDIVEYLRGMSNGEEFETLSATLKNQWNKFLFYFLTHMCLILVETTTGIRKSRFRPWFNHYILFLDSCITAKWCGWFGIRFSSELPYFGTNFMKLELWIYARRMSNICRLNLAPGFSYYGTCNWKVQTLYMSNWLRVKLIMELWRIPWNILIAYPVGRFKYFSFIENISNHLSLYLSNWKICVKVYHAYSFQFEQKLGIPQGSVLGASARCFNVNLLWYGS